MRVPALSVLLIAVCCACAASEAPASSDGSSSSPVASGSSGAGATPSAAGSSASASTLGSAKAGAGAAGTSAAAVGGTSTAAVTAAAGGGAAGTGTAGVNAAANGGAAGLSAAGAAAAGTSASAGAGAAQAPVSVGHPAHFIASIHGNADKLQYVDVADPTKNWSLDVADGIQDFQLIGNNKVLVGYKFNFGYMEVDLATHKSDVEVRDFLTRQQAILTSVKRLANGHTLIMAQGLSGSMSDLEVWEVDNMKMVYEKREFKSCCGNLRVVKLTSDGHFLVGSGNALVELDEQGKQVASLNTGGSPTYMGLKTADGTYYATNGHGGQLLSFAAGGQKKVLGGKMSSSAAMAQIYQPAQFQILQNGNVVITNWTAEDGGMGKQLVEYDSEGKLVWSWDDPMVRPQGMETLIVLDNLDPMVLNDDRDGVLKPQK